MTSDAFFSYSAFSLHKISNMSNVHENIWKYACRVVPFIKYLLTAHVSYHSNCIMPHKYTRRDWPLLPYALAMSNALHATCRTRYITTHTLATLQRKWQKKAKISYLFGIWVEWWENYACVRVWYSHTIIIRDHGTAYKFNRWAYNWLI